MNKFLISPLSNYAERFTLTIHMNVDMICRAERAVLKLIDRKQRKTRGRSAPGLLRLSTNIKLTFKIKMLIYQRKINAEYYSTGVSAYIR